MYCYKYSYLAIAGIFLLYPKFSFLAFHILLKSNFTDFTTTKKKTNKKRIHKATICNMPSCFLYLAQAPNGSQGLGSAIFHRLLYFLQPLTVTSCRPTSGCSKGS